MFATETYVQRRAELMRRLGTGLVLLPGNTESPVNFADNTYPFRQDSTFLYYFGLDQPDLAAVLDVDTGTATVFGDELTIDHIVWMGNLPTVAERAAQAGVAVTRPLNQMAGTVSSAVAAGRPVHYLPPYRAENVQRLSELLDTAPGALAEGVSVPLIQAVVDMRAVKTDEEIAELDRAASVSVDMHVAAMAMARPGLYEYEIAAEVERVAQAAGCRLAFSVIATVRGEILHNHHHGNILKSGDLFLLDAGAESPLRYAGDLSSTFPVDPVFTDRQKVMYDLSLAAHAAAVDTVTPGVPNRDVHFAAARTIVEGMQDLGLMKGNVEAALQAGAHALFFPCGVGHMMGLDVHDMEDLGEKYVGYEGRPKSPLFGLKSLRLARPLLPGFVLTVEPGIYFIPQLIDLWRSEGRFPDFLVWDEIDKWRDFGGIRNEEDYLVTESGKRLLGKKKPLTVAEVEAVRAG